MRARRSNRWGWIVWSLLVVAGIIFVVKQNDRNDQLKVNAALEATSPKSSEQEGDATALRHAPTKSMDPKTVTGSAGSNRAADVGSQKSNSIPPVGASGAPQMSGAGSGLGSAPGKASRDFLEAQKNFRAVAEAVFNGLPTFQSTKGLTSASAHETPDIILRVGDELGKIAESLDQDPRLASDGVQFYRQCYKRSDLLPQVRAVCLADFRHWNRASSGIKPQAEDLTGVPQDVLDLASQIPADEK